MRTRFLLVLAIFTAWVGSLAAQQICESNGCGTKWNRWLVPDSPFGISFRQACDAHDVCYAGCPVTGEKQGLYSCETGATVSLKTRACCDDTFLLDLVNSCRSQADSSKLCKVGSALYFLAVDAFGSSAFTGTPIKEWLRDKVPEDPFFQVLEEEGRYIAAKLGPKLAKDQRAVIQLNPDGSVKVLLFESMAGKTRFALKNRAPGLGEGDVASILPPPSALRPPRHPERALQPLPADVPQPIEIGTSFELRVYSSESLSRLGIVPNFWRAPIPVTPWPPFR